MTRTFLPWTTPFLPATAARLADRFTTGDTLDLTDVWIVLPGNRAGRRLLGHLLDVAEARNLALDPPRVLGAGHLPGLLLDADRDVAGPAAREAAWLQALRGEDPEALHALLPHAEVLEGWSATLALARLLDELHTELAQQRLDFASVHGAGDLVWGTASEAPRWAALARVEASYRRHLKRAGLRDAHTATTDALTRTPRAPGAILLLGVPELSRTLRDVLATVADRVEAWVFAPEESAERFDPLGCVLPEAWPHPVQDPEPEQVHIVDGPADQAFQVLRILATHADAPLHDISVGLLDDEIEAPLRHALDARELSAHLGGGRPLRDTPAVRLLQGLQAYLARHDWASLAALVRHPAVESRLEAEGIGDGDLLPRLDREVRERLPHELPPTGPLLASVAGAVDHWLAPLRGPDRPLSGWARPLVETFAALEPGDDPDILGRILDCARDLDALPVSLAKPLVCSAADALEFLVRLVAAERVPDPPRDDAVELLGWLELALDDAPHLVVAGANEGMLPPSQAGHAFLPDRLRTWLGMPGHTDRLARDAYLLSAQLASKQSVAFVAGRVRENRDPCVPSRFLLGSAPATMADRVHRLLGDDHRGSADVLAVTGLVPGEDAPTFRTPPPPDAFPPGEPDRITVTGLGLYTRCPYRWFLQHVQGLRTVEHDPAEMDGQVFGILGHDVLEKAAKSDAFGSERASTVEDLLHATLADLARQQFGSNPRAAVRIQLAQLRTRLGDFARWQADRTREGWRVLVTEHNLRDERGLDVDGNWVPLRGRIDRVDQHEDGTLEILDYKTSDGPKDPGKTHLEKDRWVDFQLPLYEWLFRQWWERTGRGAVPEIELGFVVLSREEDSVHHERAKWGPEERAAAVEAARVAVRGIRQRIFWPPADPPPPYSRDLSPLTLDGQFQEATQLESDRKAREGSA